MYTLAPVFNSSLKTLSLVQDCTLNFINLGLDVEYAHDTCL